MSTLKKLVWLKDPTAWESFLLAFHSPYSIARTPAGTCVGFSPRCSSVFNGGYRVEIGRPVVHNGRPCIGNRGQDCDACHCNRCFSDTIGRRCIAVICLWHDSSSPNWFEVVIMHLTLVHCPLRSICPAHLTCGGDSSMENTQCLALVKPSFTLKTFISRSNAHLDLF